MKVAVGGAAVVLVILLAQRIRCTGVRRAVAMLIHGAAWDEPAWLPRLPAADSLLWWLAHGAGLAYLWRLAGRSYALALPLGLASAALLLLPQWPALLRRGKPDVTVLTPLAVPYAVGLLWGLHMLPPEPGRAFLQAAELAAAGYVILVQLERRKWNRRLTAPAAVALLGATGLWALVEYVGGCTRGVTGSDPYCYAQMAVDLARTGDPRHIFALVPAIRGLGIPWWPLVHVGYHVPEGATGLAATVWPVGWPVLLAAGYRLLGETGLYVWAPVMGLLALAATGALVAEVWPRGQGRRRWLGIALAVFILATSREQVLQLLVPMADVPAQLFTVLAVWLALRAGRCGSWPLALAAGAATGAAYDIRHSQVLLAPAVALALWQGGGTRRARAWLVALAALGACLVAAPDLWYHRVAMGSLWRPESPETNLIGLAHWWSNGQRMAGAMASRSEFGLLLPAVLYGLWRLWRDARHGALVLLVWVLVDAGVQFLYGPLRWRDLLSVEPALAVLAAYGAASLPAALARLKGVGAWLPGWLALGLALLLAWRSAQVLAWPAATAEMTFGYLRADEREAFARLGALVEADAVVGTALNSGPVEMYTGRQTFRPGDWSAAELETFLGAMAAAGRPVYLLDDGNEQAATVARLRQEGRLVPVERLSVPLYGDRDRLSGTLYRVRQSGVIDPCEGC